MIKTENITKGNLEYDYYKKEHETAESNKAMIKTKFPNNYNNRLNDDEFIVNDKEYLEKFKRLVDVIKEEAFLLKDLSSHGRFIHRCFFKLERIIADIKAYADQPNYAKDNGGYSDLKEDQYFKLFPEEYSEEMIKALSDVGFDITRVTVDDDFVAYYKLYW